MFQCKSAITGCSRKEIDIFFLAVGVSAIFFSRECSSLHQSHQKIPKIQKSNNKRNAMMNVCACLQLNCNSLASVHEAHLLHLCGWYTKRSCLVHWTHLHQQDGLTNQEQLCTLPHTPHCSSWHTNQGTYALAGRLRRKQEL
jgi:hypothetical protein